MRSRGRAAIVGAAIATVASCTPTRDRSAVSAPTGFEAVRLTRHSGEDRAPDWSPDGESILFESDRSGNAEIYSVRWDGSAVERWTEHPAADRSPAWAPDGTRFVFQSDRECRPGLWVFDLETRSASLLVEDASPELVPDWSPDSEWIAFASARSGVPNLYRVRVDDGRVERLTESRYRDLWPRYSPDGRRIVFFSRRDTGGEADDLYVLDLTDRSIERVTERPERHDFTPAFAPDGDRVVSAISVRERNLRDLVVHDLRDGGALTLGYPRHRIFHPVLSPDGRWLVFAARLADGERADLYRVPAPGAELP